MDFPNTPNHPLPARLTDRATAGRYSNGLVRVVEDGQLHFAVGQRRVLDAIFGGHIQTAASQIWLAAESRLDRQAEAIHPLHLLDWVVQRADIIDGLRTTLAFSAVWNAPAASISEWWRWMLPVRSCRLPMTEADYYDFMQVVGQLQAHRDDVRTLLVDKFRQPVTV